MAWSMGLEGHVDVRRRLRRRASFDGSMVRFGLVGGERVGRLVSLYESLFSFCVF